MHLKNLLSLLCTLPLLGFTLKQAHGQSLTFDPVPATAGVQSGNGTWDTSTANWWNGGSDVVWPNTGSDIASFGSSANLNSGTITVSGTVNVGGMIFNSLSALPTTATVATTFTGGTISFASNAVIQAADNSSAGSGTVDFINFNSALFGNGLTLQRDPAGTATFEYIKFGGANPGLGGTLTLKSLTSARGIFVLTAGATSVSSLVQVVVENGSTFAASGTGQTYAIPFSIAGTGSNNGSIRIDSLNMNFSGAITLTADAAVLTNSGIGGTAFSGGIGDGGLGFGFQRLSTTQDSGLTLSGTSTYRGATTLGRSGGVTGGLTTVDFSVGTTPATDPLYHGVTPGSLILWGDTTGNTSLTLQGKAATTNLQDFGAVTVNGTRSNVILAPGAGGSMALNLGNITHVSGASIGFVSPVAGAISTTTPAGFLGTWATLSNASGAGSWAAVSGGVLTSFSGDLPMANGSTLATLPGLTSSSNLQISSASSGNVSAGGSLVAVNTVSLTDTVSARTLDIGSGNRLRLGATGGIQITGSSRDLTIGVAGTAGTLTAGTSTVNSPGQIWLTNLSPTATLTINSVIDNNGTTAGAATLFINGSGNTVLTGANLFTGATQIGSGSLEIRNGAALGATAGNTSVLMGAALRLAGNITSAEPLAITGFGVNTDGAIRNISGDNTLTGLVTLINPTRINSDSGSITYSAAATTNIITGAFALGIGGSGTTIINGRIAIGTGGITKDGSGTLVMAGDNTYTGSNVISAGVIRVAGANALGSSGTSFSTTTVSTGTALEVIGGITVLAEPVTLGSTGIGNAGGIRNISSDNTLTGLITINGTSRINSDSGTLTFDVASGGAIVKDAGSSARSLTFGGSGNITLLDPVLAGGTAALSVAKDGLGTLNMRAANTYDGTTTMAAGTMNLDFSAATSPASNILYNGLATPGALLVGGGTLQLTGKSGAGSSQAFGAFTVSPGQSFITLTQNGATSLGMSVTTLSRTLAAGVVQFTLPTTGSITTTGGADNAILSSDNIAYATANTNDWAATDAISGGKRNIVPLSSITNGYTPSTATTLAGNADVVTASVNLASGASNLSTRFNTAQDSTISLGSGTLSTGGILVGAGVGAFTSSITGGTLRSTSTNASSTNADLVIIQNNTLGELLITSVIANNATASSATSLTKAGPGVLALDTATQTYTGTTRVMDGTLWVRSGTLSASTEYTLGSGSTSGKMMLGSDTSAVTLTGDWLRTDGAGTANALVGGGSVLSSFFLDFDITSDFRQGTIGGSGTNENNLNINVTSPAALLQLGPANTFAGKTTILRGTIEVQTLTNLGLPSSLGTGSFNAASGIIDMATQTTSATGSSAIATLRYTGTTDSTTDRPIRIPNSDAATDITSVVAVIENAGMGSVKFTSAFTAAGSNPVQRLLRLTGTNTGANEIVGIGDASASITTAVEKTGTGTWALTGTSSYSGTTSVTGGILQLSSGGTTGSGAVTVASGAQLVGTGTVTGSAFTLASGATLQGGNITSGSTTGNGTLTFTPPAGASYNLATGSSVILTITSATNQAGIDSTFGGNAVGSPGYNAYVDGISGAGNHDLLVFNGGLGSTLGFSANVTVADVSFAPQAGQIFNLLDWGSLVTANFTSFDPGTNYRDGSSDTGSQLDLPTLAGTGLVWDISRFTSSGTLSIIANPSFAPEPARAVLLFAGLAAMTMRRRRR